MAHSSYERHLHSYYERPGRLEIPSKLLRQQRWEPGTQLLMMETPHGVLTMTGGQAKELIKRQIGASSLVEELIAERRSAAQT